MNRKRERIRFAKKEGWHRGHSQKEPVVQYDPETELDLCIAYDEGWAMGIKAPSDAVNPFGIFDDNRVHKTGWYKKQDDSKAHFFHRGATQTTGQIIRT